MSSEMLVKNPCSSSSCGWNLLASSKELGCSTGDGSCFSAELLLAADSSFFPKELQDATSDNNDMLSKISSPDPDVDLAFIQTPFGLMLAFVKHDAVVPMNAININSSEKEIAEGLGLEKIHKRHDRDDSAD
jgi:hypothetical protein